VAFLRHEKGKLGHSLWIADTVKQLTLQQLSAFCLSPSPSPLSPHSPKSCRSMGADSISDLRPTCKSLACLPCKKLAYVPVNGCRFYIYLILTFALLANRLLTYLAKKIAVVPANGCRFYILLNFALLANRLLTYLAKKNCSSAGQWVQILYLTDLRPTCESLACLPCTLQKILH
jgi:hypothetical protein